MALFLVHPSKRSAVAVLSACCRPRNLIEELAGAAIASLLTAPRLVDIAIEYVLGFGFGWTIFQVLFMRDTAGGSYRRALAITFIPEFLSMNMLMGGSVPIAALGRIAIAERLSPLSPDFWFVMSMALLVGFVAAYPINWWLVAQGLKHGMMTIRPRQPATMMTHVRGELRVTQVPSDHSAHEQASSGRQHAGHPVTSLIQIASMSALSIVIFAFGVYLAMLFDRP